VLFRSYRFTKMILIKSLAVLLFAATICADYTGYQLVRIAPKSQKQIELVGQWIHNVDFDMWSSKDSHIDVLLSPVALSKYKPQLDKNGVKITVLNANMQNVMDEEAKSILVQKMQLKALNQESRIVNTFARHGDINNWIDQQVAANPSFLSSASAGKTFENRDLKYIVLKSSNAAARNIWIDCGIHAREWISPSTCVYMIDALISQRNVASVKAVLDKYNIFVLPVHNPDGYEYTFTAGNRLWRKNRKVNSGSTCIGVDLNRNFGYQWMVAGASNNPCSDTFAGPTPDSELETKAVESVINSRQGLWDAFITIHTYGQFWFTPWGFTAALPSDYAELKAKSDIGAAAIRAVYGSVFSVGSSTNLLYAAAGGSDDWAKGVAGIKYSHCLELRPGQSGQDANFGFQLPVDRAPKAGEETYQGILAFLRAI